MASHGQTSSSYGFDFLPGMCTQTSQPTHVSMSISHHCCVPFKMPRSIVIMWMQSTGQTSRHDSQPVQLSALIIASSLGTFFRGPFFAIKLSLLGVKPWSSVIQPCCNAAHGDTHRSKYNHHLSHSSTQSQAGMRSVNNSAFASRSERIPAAGIPAMRHVLSSSIQRCTY